MLRGQKKTLGSVDCIRNSKANTHQMLCTLSSLMQSPLETRSVLSSTTTPKLYAFLLNAIKMDRYFGFLIQYRFSLPSYGRFCKKKNGRRVKKSPPLWGHCLPVTALDRLDKCWVGSFSQNQEKRPGKQFIEGFHLFLAVPLSIYDSYENTKANYVLFNIKYFSHFVHVLWIRYNQCWSSTLLKARDQMSCTYVFKLFDSLFLQFQKNIDA